MDDDPPTYGMCHLRLGPQMDRREAEKKAFREEMESLAGLTNGQTILCVAGDFNSHICVVEPGDEESIGTFGWGTRNREGRELVDEERVGGRGHVLSEGGIQATKSPTEADGTRQSLTY